MSIDVDFLVYTEHADVFKEAFTHRSVGPQDNERLEFLGDAVLELIATDWLFYHYPDETEGVLTSYRSALVKRENLAQVARKINLGEYLRMSKGEARSGGREKDYLLANVVEAFIGALYVTAGMETTRVFVHRFIMTELANILAAGQHIDAKSELQEITQGSMGITPSYKVLSEEGKDHEKEFEIGVFLDEVQIGTGIGKSKKEAQMTAAMKAITRKSDWFEPC